MAVHEGDLGMLRRQARAIAEKNSGAREAWQELQGWAGGRGPLAMKSAMAEFLSVHGGSPEAASIMPEIIRGASAVFPPRERGELFELSVRRPMPADLRPNPLPPRPTMGVSGGKPQLSIAFQPSREPPRLGVVERLTPGHDHAYLRDTPLRMRDQIQSSLGKPQIRAAEAKKEDKRFDSGKSPDSFSMGAQSGERLVNNLIHSVRSHGKDERYHLTLPDVPAERGKSHKAKKSVKKAADKRTGKSAMRKKPKKATPRKKAPRKIRRKIAIKAPKRRRK